MLSEIKNKGPERESGEILWAQFLEGDMEAYEKLFRMYYRDLYGYGLKLCKKPELVKDTIQELFVALWERKEGISQVISAKGYLLVSLRRMILRTLNKNSNLSELDENRIPDSANIQYSAEELMINREIEDEQKEQLLFALEMLPPRQKEVLFLRYYNGMSYEEIQEILSINYQSVRNHICRATKNLKHILDERLYKIVI